MSPLDEELKDVKYFWEYDGSSVLAGYGFDINENYRQLRGIYRLQN